MRTCTLASSLTVFLLAIAGTAPSRAAEPLTRFDAKQGSKMRIEGTSNVHDWQVEGSLIGGFLEVGSDFPMEPGQAVAPGKVDARAQAFVLARGLKSVEKDGKPYSDAMDDIMYEKLKVKENPKISYYLEELVLKEPPKSKDLPYSFDSKGELVIAGVTNKLAMPVNVLPLGDKKLKVSGTVSVKMTDFKIEPPAPKLALGLIKTGDEVKLGFEWMLAQRKSAPAPTENK